MEEEKVNHVRSHYHAVNGMDLYENFTKFSLEQFIQKNPVPMAIIDEYGSFLHLNPAFVELFKTNDKEMLESLKLLDRVKESSLLSIQDEEGGQIPKREIIFKLDDLEKINFEKKFDFNLHLEATLFPMDCHQGVNAKHFVLQLVNISPRAHITDILSERLELETLLSKLSTRLINLSFEKLEEGIIDVLEEIGRFIKIEKTGIFLFQANQTQMIEAYSWSEAKGKQIMLKSLQKPMNTRDFPSLVNLIIKDQMIVEYNVGMFDKFGLDNNCLDLWSENVNSCMLIPIIIKEQTSGFLYLLSNTREKKWTYNAKLMFKFIGEFLASTLERKRVEEKILLSEKKYKNLIENSPNLILLIDEGGNIIDLNSESASLFESQKNLFLGDSLAIFLKNLSTYYDFKLHDVYKNSNKKHSPTKYLLQLIGEKKEKWYDLVFAPLNMEGETYFQVVGHDITEEKQFESLIKQEITQLKKIDRIRTDFVYRASHELKTPLNAINCASDLLMNYTPEKLDESTLELLNIINKGGNRMKALVNDLVETFRYELQNFNLKMKKIDVMPIIEEIIKEFELQLVERNISLYVSLPKILPLKVDKLRFGLVISNLLSNAFKNTPPAGMILFKAEVKPQEVIFSFKDTGVGITEDEMNSLFKKFGKIERFGTGLDIITEGTGLGLFNTKQIVEKHGGRIWAESEGRNKGSSFFISLPRS